MDTVGGRYAIDGRLGEGGMGCVYRARHLQLGKTFALKMISPAFALDAAARARFNQEAKLASEISHPNIVSVVDFGEDDAFGAYMVMELVEGEPLLRAGSPMSVRRACDILAQIADALDHIHKRGIVHGDVKADNILVTDESEGPRRRRIARLLDFGLARRPDHAPEDQISGSPHYLAPERAAGGAPSVAADIYALGVLGYTMLSGTPPFDGDIVEILMAHISRPVESPAQRRGEPLDEALERLILRALAKDPAERHTSAAAFRYELNTVMDMLDLSRRRRSNRIPAAELSRETALALAFDKSHLAQALLTAEGEIVYSNHAFNRLVGRDDSATGGSVLDSRLGPLLPGLARALRSAHISAKPCERRARVPRPERAPLDLVVWISPLKLQGSEIHVLVRVEEAAD